MRRQPALGLVTILLGAPVLCQDWPQWGGPSRDFKVSATGLARSWPAPGPRRLWSRELGDGYSAVVADAGRLYTLYRPVKGALASLVSRIAGSKDDLEIVVALDAGSGRTLWEHAYAAPPVSGTNMEYGPGPHATPLVAGGLLFAVGATGKLHALDKAAGTLVWSRDLWSELGGRVLDRGYSCSPIAWKNSVIVTVGGKGQAVVAFDQRSGSIVWKGGGFDPSPSSPLLIDVDGQPQLVVFHASGVAGVDPNSGALLWNHGHQTDWGLNISTPVWGDDNVLFVSSAYSGGSRALRLTRSEGGTKVQELWSSNKMRIHFGNAIRVGDLVYGSSGDFGPAFLTAIDVRSGSVRWQERGLARATAIHADGRLLLLDEDGVLALATVGPSGLEVHAKADVLDGRAWTVPTLAGTTLYVRDRASISAFDLR